jgi:hypothetical protein
LIKLFPSMNSSKSSRLDSRHPHNIFVSPSPEPALPYFEQCQTAILTMPPLISLVFLLVGPALGEFTELVCEGRRAHSQFDLGQKDFSNATNLSSEISLSADSAQFMFGFEEQSPIPDDILALFETVNEVVSPPRELRHPNNAPQRQGDLVAFSAEILPGETAFWKNDQHVIGGLSNPEDEFQFDDIGNLDYANQSLFMSAGVYDEPGKLTSTVMNHQPTQVIVRRLLKVFERQVLTCVTYVSTSHPMVR